MTTLCPTAAVCAIFTAAAWDASSNLSKALLVPSSQLIRSRRLMFRQVFCEGSVPMRVSSLVKNSVSSR